MLIDYDILQRIFFLIFGSETVKIYRANYIGQYCAFRSKIIWWKKNRISIVYSANFVGVSFGKIMTGNLNIDFFFIVSQCRIRT